MRPITTTFFSTLDREQTIDCLKFLLLPWKWKNWKKGKYVKEAEELLADYLFAGTAYPPKEYTDTVETGHAPSLQQGKKRIYSFYNGRTALYCSLKIAGVSKGDEVIIQAYTCITVPNAVIGAGAKPIYCDVEESLNLDPEDLKKKMTTKTKAVIIQHTFGTPAKIDEIQEICENYCRQSLASTDKSRSHNTCLRKIPPTPPLQKGGTNAPIILIEDCAHSLGAKYKGRLVGTFGDISMFSFGRDKVISSVNGGMMCINNDKLISPILTKEGLGVVSSPPILLIIKNLFYPILAEISLKWYNKLNIGKIIMYASKKLRLFPLILNKEEKTGSFPLCQTHYHMPNVLAYLFVKQFKKLDKYNEHRKKIAEFYDEQLSTELQLGLGRFSAHDQTTCLRRQAKATESALKNNYIRQSDQKNTTPIFLRCTIFTEKAERLIKAAKKHDIYLGDWYRSVVAPKDIDLSSISYEQNMCPKAERYAALTVNLPNHSGVTMEDARKVADIVTQICADKKTL